MELIFRKSNPPSSRISLTFFLMSSPNAAFSRFPRTKGVKFHQSLRDPASKRTVLPSFLFSITKEKVGRLIVSRPLIVGCMKASVRTDMSVVVLIIRTVTTLSDGGMSRPGAALEDIANEVILTVVSQSRQLCRKDVDSSSVNVSLVNLFL